MSEVRLIDANALKEQFSEIVGEYIVSEIISIIDNAPTVEPEITEEQAIDKLHETGWLVNHDKEMTERPKGEWKDYSDEGYVECPFCGSATTCDDNKDELHYCWNCGSELR